MSSIITKESELNYGFAFDLITFSLGKNDKKSHFLLYLEKK